MAEKIDRKLLGSRISWARNAAGLSQEQLAAAITKTMGPRRDGKDTNASTVSNWESGKYCPRPKTMPHLFKALGRPADWFLAPSESEAIKSLEARVGDLENKPATPLSSADMQSRIEALDRRKRATLEAFLSSLEEGGPDEPHPGHGLKKPEKDRKEE